VAVYFCFVGIQPWFSDLISVFLLLLIVDDENLAVRLKEPVIFNNDPSGRRSKLYKFSMFFNAVFLSLLSLSFKNFLFLLYLLYCFKSLFFIIFKFFGLPFFFLLL